MVVHLDGWMDGYVRCWEKVSSGHSFNNGAMSWIMVLFVLCKLSSNVHAQPSSETGCLIFGRTLRLLLLYVCESEGSVETVRMHRLI